MAMLTFSTKRLQVDKANARMVAITAIAAIITVFSLVAAKSLLSQSSYQGRVISEKRKADKQLRENVVALKQLEAEYKIFAEAETNVLGGSRTGAAERDGSNARITLDALPSKYDFPALTSSLEKMLLARQFKIESITGTDDEVAQQTQESQPTPTPQTMSFTLTASSSYAGVRDLVGDFERSIRPFKVTKIELTGTDAKMHMTLAVDTYYQPAKNLDNTTKEIK